MGFFGSLKEKAVAMSAKAVINQKIASMGTLSELDIDPAQKTMRAVLHLKGEPSPIHVQVGAYDLSQEGGQAFLSVRNISASREWITAALNEFVVGKKFPLPAAAQSLI